MLVILLYRYSPHSWVLCWVWGEAGEFVCLLVFRSLSLSLYLEPPPPPPVKWEMKACLKTQIFQDRLLTLAGFESDHQSRKQVR